MAQILQEKGLLKEGKTGIGFGVGQERLPALFANKGVKVIATDHSGTPEHLILRQIAITQKTAI